MHPKGSSTPSCPLTSSIFSRVVRALPCDFSSWSSMLGTCSTSCMGHGHRSNIVGGLSKRVRLKYSPPNTLRHQHRHHLWLFHVLRARGSHLPLCRESCVPSWDACLPLPLPLPLPLLGQNCPGWRHPDPRVCGFSCAVSCWCCRCCRRSGLGMGMCPRAGPADLGLRPRLRRRGLSIRT